MTYLLYLWYLVWNQDIVFDFFFSEHDNLLNLHIWWQTFLRVSPDEAEHCYFHSFIIIIITMYNDNGWFSCELALASHTISGNGKVMPLTLYVWLTEDVKIWF